MQRQGSPVSINVLAKEEDISSVFLEQIFFRLRKAGIVTSVRGPGGGFCFAKPLQELTVREILDAAGEDLELVFCEKHLLNCRHRKTCSSHSVWEDISGLINKYLDGLTLAMVLEKNVSVDDKKVKASAPNGILLGKRLRSSD
jgi:Rrf2 family iron-sulfur cluster assembly transcriptional regulator